MKIFAIYSVVSLEKKPDWLDDFRNEFNEPWELHITYKQPAWINENEVILIKNKLSNICKGFASIKVKFDQIVVDKGEDEKYCIMIKAKENVELNALQKNIIKGLTDRFKLREEETRSYELNFMPHITIGRDVEENDWLKHEDRLKNDCFALGKITEVILSVVKEVTIEEAKKEKNMFRYRL